MALKNKPKIRTAAQDNLKVVDLERVNSSSSNNTLERATNQNDILRAMTDENGDPQKPKPEIMIDIQPKLTILKKKTRQRQNELLSKSFSDVKQKNEDEVPQTLQIGDKSIKV